MLALIGWVGRVLLILFIVRLVMSVFGGGMRRRGARAAGGPGRGGPANGTGKIAGTRLVRDPQCGTYVAETTAVRTLHGGEMLYFCSNKCRDAYMAAPQANAS